MKLPLLLFVSFVLFVGQLPAPAIKEGYVTRSSPTTNTAEIFFPQNPTKAIRLLSYDALGDTNTAILSMLGGTMPLTITGVINVTNLVVTANTNVQTNAIAIIQRNDDTIFSLNVLFTNQFTNIFFTSNSIVSGVLPTTNDILWVCTNICTTPIGSNALVAVKAAGPALFAVQRRAPVALRLAPSGVNANRIFGTVYYEDNP